MNNTKARPRLYLVTTTPLASFEERGREQAREAAERLIAVEILARYNKSPEVQEALSATRSAMVTHRLINEDCQEIEQRAIADVVRVFLDSYPCSKR